MSYVNNWEQKRKRWRRRELDDATRRQDFRPAWVIIEEAKRREVERRRLFGYVLLKSGEYLTITEAHRRLADGHEGHPKRERLTFGAPITKDDVREWVDPKSERDVTDSIGEVDVPLGASYPALHLSGGEVLSDPKTRPAYHDPLKVP